MGNEKYTLIETVGKDGRSSLFLMDQDGFYKRIGQYLDRGGVAIARLTTQRVLETLGYHAINDIAVRIITYIPHGQFAKAITYTVPSEGAASLV